MVYRLGFGMLSILHFCISKCGDFLTRVVHFGLDSLSGFRVMVVGCLVVLDPYFVGECGKDLLVL